MKWPWRRWPHDDDQRLDEAREELDHVRDQWPAVRREAAAMRDRRLTRDQFAEQIRIAMGVNEK